MTKKVTEGIALYPPGFEDPPFGITVLWGYRKVGKTIAALNSPWGPRHIIDVEYSSEDYEKQLPKMMEMGIINGEFTRANCLDYNDTRNEFKRIWDSDQIYGTIILDTVGQITEWKKKEVFNKTPEWKVQKMSQVIWGEIRDSLRETVFELKRKCKYLILTAHEREYNGVYSPRSNPAMLEVASVSVRLVKKPNQQIPDGIVDVARLPMFPPRIPEFSIAKLLDYMDKPADWNKLDENETIKEPLYVEAPPVED